MQILLATTNAGKVREIRLAMAGADVELISLDKALGDTSALGTPTSALGIRHSALVEPAETGTTFADNAAIKANYYSAAFQMPTVAEDSGLVIDALGGRPGVLSARYPGDTYAQKFANLYGELAPHPRPWRARFVCALCFRDPAFGVRRSALEQVDFVTEATVDGEIAPAPRGEHGFGYDPIFYYPPLGITTGEMTDDMKLTISHRGKAFRQFREWIRHSALGTRHSL